MAVSMNAETIPAKVCVIVPAKGGGETLKKCLDSLLELDYPNKEIILVDDGIEADSRQALEGFKDKMKILKNTSPGPSVARNLASGSTDAEFIAFTDSDCIVDVNWLHELTRIFQEHPEAAGGGGVQDIPMDATEFEKMVFRFMRKCGIISDYARWTNSISGVNHLPSCNAIYRREIYLKEGGFLKGLWPGEDVEFDYRIKKQGYALFFNPKAVVYHYKPRTLKAFLTMMRRYGEAQGFLVRKYGIFRRVQFVPVFSLFFLLSLLISKVFALWLLAALFIASWLYFFGIYSLFLKGIFSWHLGFIRGLLNGSKDQKKDITD
ncbi:MAG TPA: glycosyltransferase [Candidatus Margulisiibacteriota bacterium]|nr:glycosyltransferase [Candidatus Margulisiibacteriota bacterium]